MDATESLDLAAVLGSLAERLQEQWAIAVNVSVEPRGAELPAGLGFDLHQLVRESAANAVRHGKASALSIIACVNNGQLRLDIEDDGCGFPFEGGCSAEDCTKSGVRPQSLASRVRRLSGTLSVGSGPHGARIAIAIPLGAQPARSAA